MTEENTKKRLSASEKDKIIANLAEKFECFRKKSAGT